MSNTNEEQERADRIRRYKEAAGNGPFIRQEYICVHPAVDRFWITGSMSDSPEPREALLNAHFILRDGGREDLLWFKDFNALIFSAEAYCQSLPKE